MTKLHIDFETRSTVDLREYGLRVYVESPNTDVWMCCWAIDDGDVHAWYPHQPLPKELKSALENPNVIVSGHNAGFEWSIIEFICAPRYDWPRVHFTRLDCTAARSAAMGLPRTLDGASRAMGLPVEKDGAGRRLMLQMSRPRKPRKTEDPNKLCWWTHKDKVQKLEDYCRQDVVVERELDKVLCPLSSDERRVWLLDFAMNHLRGIRVDMDAVNAVVHAMNHAYNNLRNKCVELSTKHGGPLVESYSNVGQIKAWLEYHGVEVDSMDKNATAELIADSSMPSYCRDMVNLRIQGAKTSAAKASRIQMMVGSDGRIYNALRYNAASTGRWAGQGVQLHNLPAREALGIEEAELAIEVLKDAAVDNNYGWVEQLFEQPIMAIASGVIRPLFTASEGKMLFCADFSNIEGRVLAWLANQEDLVQAFFNGDDVYKDMAAYLYGILVNAVSKAQRQLGKTIVLGCGYQMGKDRFFETCQLQNVEGVDVALAEKAVGAYREKNHKIVSLWYELEQLVLDAVTHPGHVAEYRDGLLAYRLVEINSQEFLICRLPSGRTLFYHAPRIEKITTPWGSEKDAVSVSLMSDHYMLVRRSLYGGLLTENCIAQGTQVLTDSGWKAIELITPVDKIHDGVEFVAHDGLVFQGIQNCTSIDGVYMTPDHEVLTDEGWEVASQNPRPYRPDIRSPDCRGSGQKRWEEAILEGAMRLWDGRRESRYRSQESHKTQSNTELWLQDQESSARANVYSRNVETPSVQRMAFDARSLSSTNTSRMAQLRGSWDLCLRGLAFVRELLARHGRFVPTGADVRSDRQQRQLLESKLSMGYPQNTEPQQARQQNNHNRTRHHDRSRNSGTQRDQQDYDLLPSGTPMAYGSAVDPTGLHEPRSVYDILNCGPRQRFVVKGKTGPFIVHNCVQAIARDLLSYSMFSVEQAGYKTLLTVHDEVVTERDPETGSVEELEQLMSQVPDWAKGCPVAAEGWTGFRYRK